MGRPPLYNQRINLNLDPDDLARIKAIVGEKGISKFVRDVVAAHLDQVAPGDEAAGPPYFDYDGSHEPRLAAGGRAHLFQTLRRTGSLDELMRTLGYTDPVEFLHALLGYKSLPNQAVRTLVTDLLPKV